MNFHTFETVVLRRPLPQYQLRAGDVGAVVEVYDGGGLEVEFVTGSGRTQALVSLQESDVRAVGDAELLAVRTVTQAA